jgi:hypothetical protein
VAELSWKTSDGVAGASSPRFSRQRRNKASSSLPKMIRASKPLMKWRRSRTVLVVRSILPIAPPFTELVSLRI